jgi:hypothetical protein
MLQLRQTASLYWMTEVQFLNSHVPVLHLARHLCSKHKHELWPRKYTNDTSCQQMILTVITRHREEADT